MLPQPERAMAMEKLPNILEGTYFVFSKVGKFASLMRKYNAIPRISKCLKFIMPRFKTGRKIMKYYSLVKAENEGRTVIPTPPKPNPILTLAATLLNLTNKYPLFTIRPLPYPSLRSMASSAPVDYQAFKRTTPRYFGVTRKDQTKKYQYLSKRRRRYQQRKVKPIPVMMDSTPSIGELLLAHWQQFTPYDTPPTTKLVTKGLLDLLPDPNQVPYYANLALDVFDTHFDTVNSKVKTIYNAIKNKFLDMGGSSESDSSYYYDSYANETDSNSTSSESGCSSSCSSDEDSSSNITSSCGSSSAGNSTEDDQYYSESGSGTGSEGESSSYDSEDGVDSKPTVGTDKKNKNLNVSSTVNNVQIRAGKIVKTSRPKRFDNNNKLS